MSTTTQVERPPDEVRNPPARKDCQGILTDPSALEGIRNWNRTPTLTADQRQQVAALLCVKGNSRHPSFAEIADSAKTTVNAVATYHRKLKQLALTRSHNPSVHRNPPGRRPVIDAAIIAMQESLARGEELSASFGELSADEACAHLAFAVRLISSQLQTGSPVSFTRLLPALIREYGAIRGWFKPGAFGQADGALPTTMNLEGMTRMKQELGEHMSALDAAIARGRDTDFLARYKTTERARTTEAEIVPDDVLETAKP